MIVHRYARNLSARLDSLAHLVLGLAERLAWLPPLLTRLTVGVVFIQSGWGKLRHLDRVTGYFASLGIPAPEVQAPFVAGTELACGLLLVIGLLSRIAAVPLIGVMVVALATAKADDIEALSDAFGLVEFTYILLFLYVAVAGPGPCSLDHLLTRWLKRPPPPGPRRPRSRRP